MSKIKLTCDNCGEEMLKYESQINDLNFCSRQCSAEWHSSDMVQLICDYCGQKFEKKEFRVRDNNFCSKKCNNKWISSQGNTEICDWCGEEFKMPPKEVKEHNFCCHEHYAKWLSENNKGEDHPKYSRKTIYCDYCGTPITRPQWHIERRERMFCNHECYSNFLQDGKVLTYCTNCGERMLMTRYRYLQYKNSFCSLDCSQQWHKGKNSPTWKGGYDPYYGGNFAEQRKKALNRDEHQCQICHTDEDLVVHHKIPVRVFKKKSKNNEEIDWEEVNSLDNLVTLCRSCHSRLEQGGFNNLTESNITVEVS